MSQLPLVQTSLREYVRNLPNPDDYQIWHYRMVKGYDRHLFIVTTPDLQSEIIRFISFGGFAQEEILNHHTINNHVLTKAFFIFDEASNAVDSHHNPVLFNINVNEFLKILASKNGNQKIDISCKRISSDCDCGGKMLGYKDSETYGHAQWCIVASRFKS